MSADPNKLGIFVTSPEHTGHLLGIVRAAVRAGMSVKVFLSFKAVHITKSGEFAELSRLCAVEDLVICVASYTCEGYNAEVVPPGLTGKQMATQTYHGLILEECGKYLTL